MLLALDTSTRTIGLALYDGVQVLGESMWTSKDHHTVELAPAVADLLDRCGIEVASVQALAVALGPGSFTGLRIGLALAKGLALVRHLPLVGIPTLDILAAAQVVQPGYTLAAVLRAGRGRLAVGWYRAENDALDTERSLDTEQSWQPGAEVEVLTATELSQRIHTPTLVLGELNEDERRILARKRKNIALGSPAQCQRRAAYLAELGWHKWQAGQIDDPAILAPIYLHYSQPIPTP